MLDKKEYSREELIKLFNTDRLDAIKAKIKRQGYLFTESGRGKSYKLTIKELPKDRLFKRYCVENLGFNESIDERKLKAFIINILNNENFVRLQISEMREELKEQGVNVSEATISKYYQQLINAGIISPQLYGYVYYVFDKETQHNRYITKDEYQKLYNEYWDTVRQNKGFEQAEINIRKYYGTKPKKRLASIINGIYSQQLNELERIINGE